QSLAAKPGWTILAVLLASPVWRRHTVRDLGFQTDNFCAAAKQACWAAVPLLLLLVFIGILSGRIATIPFGFESTGSAVRYTVWGTFQQYGLQGYFHNRLSKAVPQPLWSSGLIAFVFMSFHLPNPVLMTFS